MEWNNIHRSFRLNDISFNSVNELIKYSEISSKELSFFLKEWFSDEDFIKVNTSGSTGKPKTIFLKKEYVINSAKATDSFFGLSKNTNALLCLPTTYIAGKLMVVRALILGWHLDVVLTSLHPLNNVNKQYDFSAMTPMQVENSLYFLNTIKQLIVGGGVVSKSLEEKLQTLKTKVFATYGMTETITHIAVKKLNHKIYTPNYYQLLPGVEIYKDQRDCLVIKAPKITDDIIFTNDVVQLISDKQFNWLGRFDNVINSGGIKLQPEVIENKLSNVLTNRFFVTGFSDEYLGEKLVLIVEGKETKINFTKSNLTKYEVPKTIYFLDGFIETETGKVNRKQTKLLLEK